MGKLEEGRKSRAHVLWSRMAMLYSDDLAAQDQSVSGRAPSDMDLDSAPACDKKDDVLAVYHPDLSRRSNWTATAGRQECVRIARCRSPLALPIATARRYQLVIVRRQVSCCRRPERSSSLDAYSEAPRWLL